MSEDQNMIAKLVTIAQSQVGVRESGNNCGKQIRLYQEATDLEPGPWPWCAAFVCWCLREWIKDPANTEWLNLQRTTPAQWRPKTAGAFAYLLWQKSHPATTTRHDDSAIAQPGDLVVFDFSHVGIVVADHGSTISTIEGNTNGRGDRESDSGDGVWAKSRAKSLARAFIRVRTAA